MDEKIGTCPVVSACYTGLVLPTGFEGIVGVAAVITTAVVFVAAAPAVVRFGVALFRFMGQQVSGLVGLLPTRKEVWGTVYDASTKRPIPFAKVQLLDQSRRVLETRIAGTDGRYGFLASPESMLAAHVSISILPSASGYLFPSRVPITVDRLIYDNLYYGAIVVIDEKTLINFDIPMDPVRRSPVPLVLKSPSVALGVSIAILADVGFWFGAVMVPLGFVLAPNPFTFGTLCLFLGTASLRLFGVTLRPYGTIGDAHTGYPVPFALITLNDPSGQRIAFAVSDERGRYFIAAPKGDYVVSVFTPAAVQPPRRISEPVSVKRGWLTKALRV